ncbi:helix-turn-helix domain-containing protein [Corynebacterium sp.]|uniref:helix-turn-helix domain-containing protein n=1 Tax=Corynebacterium sp. TaxID=1720 RepID=UPI0026E0F5A6|nr:helix-turn-helix domain-containing protein [Corynebacterium sp.]MDO5511124.1 helix-turn-helix domain-containing protein [Corynebacterium sp.]
MSAKRERLVLQGISGLLAAGPVHLEGAGGGRLELPEALKKDLASLIQAHLNNEPVEIVRMDTMISTQEAARILGVDRTTVVRLIDNGLLTSVRHSEKGHRRLRRADVLEWQKDATRERRTTW